MPNSSSLVIQCQSKIDFAKGCRVTVRVRAVLESGWTSRYLREEISVQRGRAFALRSATGDELTALYLIAHPMPWAVVERDARW